MHTQVQKWESEGQIEPWSEGYIPENLIEDADMPSAVPVEKVTKWPALDATQLQVSSSAMQARSIHPSQCYASFTQGSFYTFLAGNGLRDAMPSCHLLD